MNAPDPALPTRSLPLKPKWIALACMLLVAYLLLRPWMVERFGWQLPGFTDVKPQAGATAPGSDPSSRAKPDKNRPVEVSVIPEQAEPLPADEAADSESTELPHDTEVAVTPDHTPVVPKPTDPPRSNKTVPANSPKAKPSKNPEVTRVGPTETPKNTPPKPNTGRPTTNTPPAAPEKAKLGVLKQIGRDRFESTSGLIYSQYRIDHVMEHGQDNTDKPSHGVFEGTKDEILALVDEAYQIAQKRGPPQVVIEEEGDRTTYTVNLNRKVGHAGGQSGARRRNPPLKMVKIVLEGQEVITAYPTNN